MPIVPFGMYSPDLPALENPGALTAKNVYSRTVGSYGPLPSLSAYSGALTARCQGMYSALDNDGNTQVFAGDATKLYKLTASSTVWEDVSRAAGYTTSSDAQWRFMQYGLRILAANFADEIQSYVIGTSTDFANLSSAAPKCRYLAPIKNFVLAGNTYDATDGNVPNRVRWSAYDDPTDWPVIGSADAAEKQSDFQDLPDGGWVQGILGGLGSADGAVFLENKIFRVTYIGPPAIFQFDEIEGARGTPAPGSIVRLGAFCFYLGEDDFYAFDGSNSVPIGDQKVAKTFFADLDQSYFSRISSAIDPINKLVFWSYPGSGSTDGTPNKLIIYNWSTKGWSTGEPGSHEIIGRTQSFGQTLESLDNISASIDDLALSLDSRAWTGGRLILSAFDTSHQLNYFTGSALEAVIDTGEFTGNNGQRLYIDGARILVDGGTPTLSIIHRSTPGGATTMTTASTAGDDGIAYNRVSARYARARVTIPAGSSWTHAQGIEPVFVEDGAR